MGLYIKPDYKKQRIKKVFNEIKNDVIESNKELWVMTGYYANDSEIDGFIIKAVAKKIVELEIANERLEKTLNDIIREGPEAAKRKRMLEVIKKETE